MTETAGSYGPGSFPFNSHIVNHRIQFRGNPVVLTFGEYNGPAIVAVAKSLEDLGRVIRLVPFGIDSTVDAIV